MRSRPRGQLGEVLVSAGDSYSQANLSGNEEDSDF